MFHTMTGKTLFVAALMAGAALISGCRSTGGGDSHDGHNHSHGSLSSTEPNTLADLHDPSEPHYTTIQDSSGTPMAAVPRPQRTCPVTGEELGSMGAPIPVKVKGRTIYVCCQGCVRKVKANPDRYLAKVDAEVR